MRIENQHSDPTVLAELGTRLMRARLERNLTQAEFAANSGVSKRTIERLEAGRSVQLANFLRVVRALKLGERLDQLIPPTGPSPIDQLKLKRRERRRASARKASVPKSRQWTWADAR